MRLFAARTARLACRLPWADAASHMAHRFRGWDDSSITSRIPRITRNGLLLSFYAMSGQETTRVAFDRIVWDRHWISSHLSPNIRHRFCPTTTNPRVVWFSGSFDSSTLRCKDCSIHQLCSGMYYFFIPSLSLLNPVHQLHFTLLLMHFTLNLVHFPLILMHFPLIFIHFTLILIHFTLIMILLSLVLIHFTLNLIHFTLNLISFYFQFSDRKLCQKISESHKDEKNRESLFTFCKVVQMPLQFNDFFYTFQFYEFEIFFKNVSIQNLLGHPVDQ